MGRKKSPGLPDYGCRNKPDFGDKNASLFPGFGRDSSIFICDDGNKILAAVEDAISTNMPVTVSCYSKGLNSKDELVSEFWITWSLKARNM